MNGDAAVKTYKHIGVAQVYPWRPHASQRDYLLKLARNSGAETSELVCRGAFAKCYDKQFQTLGFGSIDHCVKCHLGRSRMAKSHRQFPMDWSMKDQPVEGEEKATLSNRAALIRAEVLSDLDNVTSGTGLLQAYRTGYHSTMRWIDEFGVDLILVFNGRIDFLKGVVDAATARGVDFMSYERPWFGDGLVMLPNENCLGMRHIDAMCAAVGASDLAEADRLRAERIIVNRVQRTTSNEWRDFQKQDEAQYSDVRDQLLRKPKVLVLPSSNYEIWGHDDWTVEWADNFEALDYLQAALGIPFEDFLIRGHPVWGQRVGVSFGHTTSAHYQNYCDRRGITYIPPESSIHTSALIELADIVVLNGSSSVMEAIWRGKPVISLAVSAYQNIGACPTLTGPGQPIDIPDDATRRRQIVKFVHAVDRVAPTFVDHLRAISSGEQQEYEGGDFGDVLRQMHFDTLMPPGKNTAPAGALVDRPPMAAERIRSLFKFGDR